MDPNVVPCVGTCEAVRVVVLSVVWFFALVIGFAYATVIERRFVAFIQARLGPNRAGPWGLLQPVADGIKLIFKEDLTPQKADKVLYWLAPVITVMPALLILAVVPVAPTVYIPWFDGNTYSISLSLTDVNIGVLYIMAIGSIAVYGIIIAGWASANKYSLLGGLRSSAQMISYELSMAVAMTVPVLLAGTMSVAGIVEAQIEEGPFFLYNPIAAVILIITLVAEANRAPFDLPDAEQEIIAGYHIEYSGMKFALFFMAEYIKAIAISLIAASLFFAGFAGPGIDSDLATGRVELSNRTGEPVLIEAGTVVRTDDEYPVYFQTVNDVTVPGSGTATVEIKALQRSAGLLGNVDAGAITVVEGEAATLVYVTNPAPTTGGGTPIPFMGVVWTFVKVVLGVMFLVWLRGTLPRFRYNMLMDFGWKILLPLSLFAAAWTAVALVLRDTYGEIAYRTMNWIMLAGFGVAVIGGLIISVGRAWGKRRAF